jgi:hypothetical protein
MKIIEFIVSPQGRSRIETKGFSGPSCRDASRELQNALGCRSSERMTNEYHELMAQYNQVIRN